MRALQMNPVNGSPQKCPQSCLYMCTYAVLAHTLIFIAVPLVLQGDVKKGKTEGDMEYEVPIKGIGTFLSASRYIIMFCIYIGFSFVIYSVFTIQHPLGESSTHLRFP